MILSEKLDQITKTETSLSKSPKDYSVILCVVNS